MSMSGSGSGSANRWHDRPLKGLVVCGPLKEMRSGERAGGLSVNRWPWQCVMVALDGREETLLSAGAALDLKAAWMKHSAEWGPHFVLTDGKRAQALTLGAEGVESDQGLRAAVFGGGGGGGGGGPRVGGDDDGQLW